MNHSLRQAKLISLLLICGSFVAGTGLTTAQSSGQVTSLKSSHAVATQDDRVRPPAGVSCNPNNLTVYTGTVTKYSRSAGLLALEIHTDSDTNEPVTFRYPSKGDPSPWFLFRGRTFRQSDWSKIESSRGHLRPDMRASAWVCSDGRKPIIDWQPAE